MPSSDSEGFESADEGHLSPTKRDRKKRLSSSNYSDNLESDTDTKKPSKTSQVKTDTPKTVETTDGWDDFDVDDEPIPTSNQKSNVKATPSNIESKTDVKTQNESKDTGWDDFDDWGEADVAANVNKPEPNIKEVTECLAQTSTKSDGWGWGWGVDSLLSSATAGITTLTSQVSQGISTVLETGIGAPDPEELARRKSKETAVKSEKPDDVKPAEPTRPEDDSTSGDAFPFGSIFSGVTKFVETTGTKVIAGGLDTLETIGKKTMEVLQDGDPGLAKKRAMLGLDSGDKPVLSQVLREAKQKADEEDKIKEAKREAKEVHYENLFDDFEGLVHLEALEMLSKQVSMRIEERLRGVDPGKRQEIKETLQQVAELCEMPEEDDDDVSEDDEEQTSADSSKADALHDRLLKSTRDIGLKIQFQPLIKQYADILSWLEANEDNQTEKTIYKRAVSGLAQTTALSVEIYHKTAEMLLVKTRRSTADEADALTQMTVVLTKHISELATLFTEKLNAHPAEDKQQINNYITNVFLEAGNSSKYIENAFQLALPILQIGAV
ncbi:protein FAM114A2 [Epargyreus clarus]|uniref:protein FAM114A2 n=1 Tax=Epargyreus clarus TaxID=520877 RepID=UPI003C2BAD03